MEPKLPTPNLGPEQSPIFQNQGFEQRRVVPTPEVSGGQNFERPERREIVRDDISAIPVLPTPVVAIQPQQLATDDNASISAVPGDDTPLVAKDEDLIEKEWVDKAKKIIVETKEDPYRREREVSLLQADYLRKRYGKELGASQ